MLSKSSFVKGLQCHKQLFMYKNHPELTDPVDAAQQAVFDTGHNVGELATRLFPGGQGIPHEEVDFTRQVELTKEWIKAGMTTIYEAAFAAGGVFARIDILHRGLDGWEIYEVKSSTKVKDVYLSDIAVQYYALEKAGLKVSRACLVTLNSDYRRQGELEIDKLFTIHDLTESTRERQPLIVSQVRAMEEMLATGTMPEVDISPHCHDPYRCAFFGTCHGGIPQPSVFDLANLDKRKAYRLYHAGCVTFDQIPLHEVGFPQQVQIQCTLEKSSRIDRPALQDFLASLWYPLCYLDFETTYMVAVPIFDGTGPYQQVPFQFSLHIQQEQGGPVEHIEFLTDPTGNPQGDFLAKLEQSIPTGACLLAYNMNFEKGRLTELGRQFPEYRAKIYEWQRNMRDLMGPFKAREVYSWQQNGSYSIKEVLPALIPEMSYKDLAIADGGAAAAAYLRMRASSDAEEIARLREGLLVYCKLDTFAMVELLTKLHALAAE
ncbi:MAG: DUF2779 domain-containing protein [Deltaproteobacteria bacterium]|nr:MAG: DUF2779 domain-containing protein [Deltaproteobacteria bacterium]